MIRKYIFKLFLFITFCLGFYIIAISAWGTIVPNNSFKKNLQYKIGAYGHMATRISQADTIKNVDFLIIGSSHAYRGFDTRIFEESNFSAFNLGSSSQSHIQSRLLLEQYIDLIQPKYIIYEVYSGTLSNDGVESSLDLIANTHSSLSTFKMVYKINHLKTWNAYIYSFWHKLFLGRKKYNEPLIIGDDKYINGGFVEKEMAYNSFEEYKKSESLINKKQKKALIRNLKFLENKQVPFILVQAPVNSRYYSSTTNQEEFNELYESLGNYVNYNEIEIGLNDTLHFYDDHHLNQSGVNLFNESFIQTYTNKLEF